MATVPLLRLCLAESSCLLFRGRDPGRSRALDDALSSQRPVLLLYPSRDAVQLSGELARACEKTGYCLLILDGTWQECTEMHRRLEARLLLSHTRVLHVKLAGASNDGSCLIRSEPAPGRVCTAEAVGRALAVLESESVCESLLQPLRLLVSLQRKRDHVGKGVKGGSV